jgi:hypothetical protein
VKLHSDIIRPPHGQDTRGDMIFLHGVFGTASLMPTDSFNLQDSGKPLNLSLSFQKQNKEMETTGEQ